MNYTSKWPFIIDGGWISTSSSISRARGFHTFERYVFSKQKLKDEVIEEILKTAKPTHNEEPHLKTETLADGFLYQFSYFQDSGD